MVRISFVTAGILAALSFAASAQELLSVPGPEMGINVIPASRNRWTSQRIQPADESRLNTPIVRTDLDLFTLEYGAPLKPWSFAVPETGTNFLWGAAFDDPEGVAIRWGKGWCDLTSSYVWIEADIVSSVLTEWRFVQHTRKGKKTLKKFTVKPGAPHVCENLGQFRELSLSDGGVELVVKGAGADVDVKSLVVAPGPVPVSVRRRFTLDEKPWHAALSLRYRSGYTVDVNVRPENGKIAVKLEHGIINGLEILRK